MLNRFMWLLDHKQRAFAQLQETLRIRQHLYVIELIIIDVFKGSDQEGKRQHCLELTSHQLY